MENKRKLYKLLILACIILIALFTIKLIRQEDSQEIKKIDIKDIINSKKSKEYKEKSYIETVNEGFEKLPAEKIYTYFNYLNDQKHYKAYNMLSYSYRKYKFSTFEDYKNAILKKYPTDIGSIGFDLNKIEVDNRFVYGDLLIFSMREEYSPETDEYFEYDDTVVYDSLNDNYISFDGFMYSKPINKVVYDEKVEINLKKIHKLKQYIDFDIEFKNITNSPVNVAGLIEHIKLIDKQGKKVLMEEKSPTLKYRLEPDEKNTFRFRFIGKLKELDKILIKISKTLSNKAIEFTFN